MPARTIALASLAGLALAACGCGEPAGSAAAQPRPGLVLAAASLTAAFTELQAEFERGRPHARLELHFAGTPQLVVQLREGVPADVFASADPANMESVAASGICLETPRVFARNRLVVVVAPGNPLRIAGLADLARAELKVALCAPRVPAGEYARQALRSAGVAVTSLSDEPSVKAVVTKVALGELDATIAYATDALAARGSVDAVEIPERHGVRVAYPIVLLAKGHATDAGRAFVEFVMSAAGQGILAKHGFERP